MQLNKVSRHAIDRFNLRVDATLDYNATHTLLWNLWIVAEVADDNILSVFRLTRETNTKYRVATYQDCRILLIGKRGALVTIFTLDTTSGDYSRRLAKHDFRSRKRREKRQNHKRSDYERDD